MKELHLASSMKELNDSISSVNNIVKGKSVTQIICSEKKLLEEAAKYDKAGDEENAYVFYGRYITLLSVIQKRPDYQKQKDYIKRLLGGNDKQSEIMDKLERLASSLEVRYRNKQEDWEYFNSPPPQEISLNDVTANITQNEVKNSITCMELYEMMEKESSRILIFDCRPEDDYQQSRILFNFLCNDPENLCIMGMSERRVRDKLPNESKVFWEMRKNRSTLIFVDWFNTKFVRNSPAWHLRSILTEWDLEMDKKPEILLLEGGYDRWLMTYPMKCSDPHVKPPKDASGNFSPSMDDIEYPNVEDIVMKDTSMDASMSKTPQVDRSTKNNAMKASENVSQQELLEYKEQLMNKSIQNNKELIKLANDYGNKENDEDVVKQQNVLYKIYELNTKQKDMETESSTIDEQLQIIKKEHPVLPSEKSKVEDLENRLKIKADEQKKVQMEAFEKIKAREEILSKARATKPNFESPLKPRKSELILSPRSLKQQNGIPRFDRAVKPIKINDTLVPQEFSPVYGKVERGLTGLKNLGNTCYMNSIIQCLSHTISLTQFILENAYETHINRSNSTKGHIIRTLAALIKMLWGGDCKYISSKNLKAVMGDQQNLFIGCEQQDAHEFLILLIDWLQSDLQTIHMNTTIESASEKAWLEYTNAKESYILRLFYGQIKSTLKCTTCGEESATFDTFSNLSLELPPIDIDRNHLTQCFNSYFHGERISGWNCPRCKEARDAIKKLDISKLPPVLIIHLKRFYADSYSYRKKTVYVDFPLSNLDMLPYVAPKERMVIANTNRVYNLYAIANHYGTLESGHYTAFCLNARQKKWYKFDDQNVSPVDRSDVRSSAAYVLFYTCLPDTNFITA